LLTRNSFKLNPNKMCNTAHLNVCIGCFEVG